MHFGSYKYLGVNVIIVLINIVVLALEFEREKKRKSLRNTKEEAERGPDHALLLLLMTKIFH